MPDELSIYQSFRKARRKRVKRFGKKLTRGLSEFFARQSLVPDVPIHDNRSYPFLERFVDNWPTIHSEVMGILKHREAIPFFQQVSSDQSRIARGNNWRTFILFGFGQKVPRNCKYAPVTTALLETVPNLQSAWFSILAPGYHIPAHRGVTKGILRAHLGLIIPKEAAKCRMRVSDLIQSWWPGELFVFDDTYEHEIWNDTDEERVILIFDFVRPMRYWGGAVNSGFLQLLKLTAYYQEPKRNLKIFEDRFESAVRRAEKNNEI